MGNRKRQIKVAIVKKILRHREKKEKPEMETIPEPKVVPIQPTCLYFAYNKALGPPYHVLLDANFICKSVYGRLNVFSSTTSCLYANATFYVTDCIIGELEKLGQQYRLALDVAKDEKITQLPCFHKGTYADDCIISRVTQHRMYIVATNDKGLKKRIREIPGVPIMYAKRYKYAIERLPDAPSDFL